jgi:hypothetical protein
VASRLGKTATGGSDSHQVSEIGLYATRFPGVVTNEADLIEALRSRDVRTVASRKERGV